MRSIAAIRPAHADRRKKVPMFRIVLAATILVLSALIEFMLGWRISIVSTAVVCVLLGLGLGLTMARGLGGAASQEEPLHHDEEAARRDHDALLSLLGHELRNPLGAITAAVAVLQRVEGDSALARKSLGVLVRQSANLARNLNELLDAARVMGGKVALLPEPLDMVAVAERSLTALRVAQADVNHEFATDLSPVWIRADASRVEQIVAHLLAYALHVTPHGGKVELLVRREAEWAVLRVSDHGPGLDAELLARVFDIPAHGRRASERGGVSGIGLALVRRLAALQGGTASASSSPEGTVFDIRLPAIEPPLPENRTSAGSHAHALRRHSFVIVDAPSDADALCARLVQEGHTVRRATDGPQGLALIAEEHPDVAIVGLDADGIDGIDFARRTRAAGYPGLMVAALEHGRAGDLRQTLHAGFDASLDKPINADRLRELMRAHL